MSEDNPNHILARRLALLKREPMRALRECRDEYQKAAMSHYMTIYNTIAFIVGFVDHLRRPESEAARREFLSDPFWEGKPHAPKEKSLSLNSTMYVLGVKVSGVPLYDQALDYRQVVDYFVETDTPLIAIPAELKRRPIYTFLGGRKKAAEASGTDSPDKIDANDLQGKDRPARAAPKTNPDRGLVSVPDHPKGDVFDIDGDDDGEDDDDRNDGRSDEQRAETPHSNDDHLKAKHKSARAHFDSKKDLVIKDGLESEPVWELPEDETIWAQLQSMPPIGAWKQFKIIDVRRSFPR